MLNRAPKDYSVGDILRATEGSLAPSACLDNENSNCYRNNLCVTQNVFRKIEDAVNSVVDNISLEDLLQEELEIRRHI